MKEKIPNNYRIKKKFFEKLRSPKNWKLNEGSTDNILKYGK